VAGWVGMSLRDFYDNPGRSDSPEIDFGESWRCEGRGPWRVRWIEYTGELVAFAIGPDADFIGGTAALSLAVIAFDLLAHAGSHHATSRGLDQVRILGVEYDRERLDRAIAGWQQHQAAPEGLTWLTSRLNTGA
jgi:hypothetical protein